MARLVLASQSPRRREILETAGLEFIVRVRPVEEVRAEGEDPEAYVRRLAQAKAEASWKDGSGDEIVLGADTVVVLGADVLEKPCDVADARRMLELLSGREHEVITGICLRHAGGAVVDSVSTKVRFTELSDAEIESYANSGEPLDKAGAYAIQGLASKFVESIDGDFFNVVGLPVSCVYRYLQSL
jgi:septum formation protein